MMWGDDYYVASHPRGWGVYHARSGQCVYYSRVKSRVEDECRRMNGNDR